MNPAASYNTVQAATLSSISFDAAYCRRFSPGRKTETRRRKKGNLLYTLGDNHADVPKGCRNYALLQR